MARPRIVVIGASAGGIEAASAVIETLPAGFPGTVFLVIHMGTGPSVLPKLLARATRLNVVVPRDGDPIAPGHLYLAPRDCHLLVERTRVRVRRGPRQHGFRPAIDPLFISAAQSHGANVIGVVLSGALDDGTAGLIAIKREGGLAIVQNPEEAPFSSMPLSALKNVDVDAILPVSSIGQHLSQLVDGMPGHKRTASSGNSGKPRGKARGGGQQSAPDDGNEANGGLPGEQPTGGSQPPERRTLTAFRCPDCGGALWEVDDHHVQRYECHVGHRFGTEALASLTEDRLEDTLWTAVRALKEHAALRRRMAERARTRPITALARQWQADARLSDARAAQIRQLIETGPSLRAETATAADAPRRIRKTPPRRPRKAKKPR